jgi:isocitrate dehydrogenase
VFLDEDHGPGRRVGEPDDRTSHYWLAREWAEALAAQTEDAELAERFAPLAARLEADETAILDELARVQGHPVDLGGYYLPDPARVEAAMRPSAAFVRDIDEFAGVSEQADGK